MKRIILIAVIFVASVSVFGQKQWTKNDGVNIAASSAAIPAFPDSLNGFRPAGAGKDYWDNLLSKHNENFKIKGKVRVFEGEGWTEIYDFPHTMNNCSNGLFMVRWRTANPHINIESTVNFLPENASKGKKGKFGYMYGTNCEEPLFRLPDNNDNESILVDIYYEVKFWQTAP